MFIPLFLRKLPSKVLKKNDKGVLESSIIQLRPTYAEWFELALSFKVFHGKPCFINSRAELRIWI